MSASRIPGKFQRVSRAFQGAPEDLRVALQKGTGDLSFASGGLRNVPESIRVAPEGLQGHFREYRKASAAFKGVSCDSKGLRTFQGTHRWSFKARRCQGRSNSVRRVSESLEDVSEVSKGFQEGPRGSQKILRVFLWSFRRSQRVSRGLSPTSRSRRDILESHGRFRGVAARDARYTDVSVLY